MPLFPPTRASLFVLRTQKLSRSPVTYPINARRRVKCLHLVAGESGGVTTIKL